MNNVSSADMWTMTDNDLEKHYILLCKKHHPDRNKDKDTTAEFQELSALYEKIKAYRNTPLDIELRVSLSELYHGCIKDIQIPDPFMQYIPLFIPRGTMDGMTFNLETVQHKKVLVHIKEINDTRFVRDGYNLIVYLDISLVQALIGQPVIMGHFNETLNIPTNIPHTNYRHIIPGMGMPIPGTDRCGDLYVLYNVLLPKDPTPSLIQELIDI